MDTNRCINYLNQLCKKTFPDDRFREYTKLFDTVRSEHRNSNKSCTDSDMLWEVWDRYDGASKFHLPDSSPEIRMVHLIYQWIGTKTTYTFDKDVEDTFRDQTWDDIATMPLEVFDRLPVNAFAILLNNRITNAYDPYNPTTFDIALVMVDRIHTPLGYFGSNASIIFMLLDTKTDTISRPVIISNITNNKDCTFQDVYEINISQLVDKSDPHDAYKHLLSTICPYLFYLASQNAEISQTALNKSIYKPYHGTPKHQFREVKQFLCGEPSGIRIRNFKQKRSEYGSSGIGSMKAPHIRRAHYHRYWVGSGNDRHIELRWIAPVYIHEELKDYIKPTKVKVKENYE